jgi:hypothetical protein
LLADTVTPGARRAVASLKALSGDTIVSILILLRSHCMYEAAATEGFENARRNVVGRAVKTNNTAK